MIADAQLDEKQGTIVDGPLQRPAQVGVVEEDSLKEKRVAQAAAIKSENEGISSMEAFAQLSKESGSSTGAGLRSKAADEFNGEVMSDARQMFYERAMAIGTPAESALQGIAEVELNNSRDKAREDFPIRQYVNAITAPGVDAEQKETLATNMYLQDKLNEFQQGIGAWETVKDIGLSVIISPKDLFDAYQVTGEIDPFKQEDQYRKFAHWFQGLPNEEKLDVWPAVERHLVDAMPRHRAAEFMQGLIDPAFLDGTAEGISFWGTVDAAFLGVEILAAGLKLRKVLNPIKAATRAGDTERASEANFALMDSNTPEGQIGGGLDIDEWQANTNALPFNGEAVDDAIASELSPAVHERIFQFRDKMKETFSDLSISRTFTKEGFVDAEDIGRAERRLYDEYQFYVAEKFSKNDKMVNLDSVSDSAHGREFSYTVTNSDGTEDKGVFKAMFTQDDIGFWQQAPRQNSLLSELAQARNTDFMSTVKAAIRLDNTASAVSGQLRKVIKEASKPVKGFKGKPRKQKVDEVDQILIMGDDLTREFTPQQLRQGVGGIKLDEDQIEYYYNMRGVMNGLGILRNMDARRGMIARNVKNIQMNETTRFFGTPVDDATQASLRARDLRKVWIVDNDVGRAVDTNDLDMAKLYDEGYKLMRLEEDTILGGSRFKHVLVKGEKVGELPSVVLDLKKGYIPRVNPQATYFVQRFTKSTVDGLDDVVRKALRSFDNKADADAYAARMYQENGDEIGVDYKVVADKELEAFKAGDSGAGQSGGLVYSPRARKPIPHNAGTDANVPRTSALEAVELYLENTKNYMTRNDWRMGVRKKWENTAKFKLGRDVKFEEGENIANVELKTMWNKINDFSGFMDKSERKWEELVKGVYEASVDKFGRNRISDFILTQRQKDPLARLRAATFHTLLGFFNPIQLFVQAQGAAVALSMNITKPATLQRLFRQQGGLTTLQHVNFNDSPDVLRKLAKTFGYKDVDEMKATKELWDKSGLYDSVLSSADVEAAARGFPTTRGAVKRFFDSGLMFFRAGELFNRRLAFLTAIDELGGAAKLRSSDKLFKEALDRANGLTLNLGKSNRAFWQKGALSVPTQFLQIQTKTLESLFRTNGVFTKVEARRLLMGQMALYGSAGVFLGPWALRAGLDAAGFDQVDVNNMDTRIQRLATGGLTDMFAYMLGADVVAAPRGALLNGMDQTFLSLFTEESSAYEWLLGPSAVGPQRIWTKLREVAHMFPTPQDINGNVSFEAQDILDTFQFAAKSTVDIAVSPFASTSQVQKYLLMSDLGQIRDKNGNIVAAPKGGFDPMTEIATLLGFKPELLQRKYDLSEINEETRKYVEFRTQLLVNNWDSFLQEYERARVDKRDMDEDTLRNLRKRHNVLMNSISSPGVRRRVMDSYNNKIRNRGEGNSQLDRQMQRYYENMLFDLSGTFTSSDTRLIKTRDTE